MHTIKIAAVIFCIILLGACKNRSADNASSEKITINPHEAVEYINLSEIADSIKCIKLQPGSNGPMGRIREVVIKKNHIYAVDVSQQIVFVFDKTGKFVSKLDKRGQGADEYTFMGPVFIDDSEKYIELLDYRGDKTSKLKYDALSFELLEKVPFPKVNCNGAKRNNDYYYFAAQQLNNIVDNEKTNAGLIVLGRDGSLKKLFEKNIKTGRLSFSPYIESFTKNDSSELFVSLMYSNTFYRLDAGEAFPLFTVDFGKYGMDNSIGLEPIEKQVKYIEAANGTASFPVLNINNSDIMSFSYYFKQDKEERMYRERDLRQYIKLKGSNKTYHTSKIKNDLADFPSSIYISSYLFNCAHEVWHEDYLVDVVIPSYYFLNNEQKKIYAGGIGEITEDDDPVVVLMKLKK